MKYTNQEFDSSRNFVLTDIQVAIREDSAVKTGAEIILIILAANNSSVAIQLWDGTLVKSACFATHIIICRHPGALRDRLLYRNLMRLSESYLTGTIDVDVDKEILFYLETHLTDVNLSLGISLRRDDLYARTDARQAI